MSPIFRHGRLRLYLLKLLDEAPRHGYEVIRLLQDRFMGVYSPSPGTIYPRLARLEDDGLVTHDDIHGRKVYRITEKGRLLFTELLAESGPVDDARSFGLSRAALTIHVIMPGALPSLLVGLRYALSISVLILVVAEQINASAGLGYLINNARDFMRTDIIVVCLIVYAALGLGADLLVRAIEARALAWRPTLVKG